MNTMMALGVVGVSVACVFGQNASDREPTIWVLTMDGSVGSMTPRAERLQTRSKLPSSNVPPGHYMFVNRGLLYVLSPGGQNEPSTMATIDTRTGHLMAQCSVAGAGFLFRSIDFGLVSEKVYLFANSNRSGGIARSEVYRVDALSCVVLSQWDVTPPTAGDWLIYQGRISSDERELFISYHGSGSRETGMRPTSGVDKFTLTQLGPIRSCPKEKYPNWGCFILGHGSFLGGDGGTGWLSATGTARIIQVDSAGNTERTLDTGLTGSHLMEFAVDYGTNRLYAVDPCMEGSGKGRFVVVDLISGTRKTFTSSRMCGDRITTVDDRTVSISRPGSTAKGELQLIDLTDGRSRRSISTEATILDIVTVP